MGTSDMKDNLVADIKGVTTKVVKSMFAKTGSFPCVYLYKLNTVKDNITFPVKDLPKDSIICKYGQTEDFERRTKEHDYGKLEGIKIELISFSYIDPKYVSEAETNLQVKQRYDHLGTIYAGRNTKMVIQLAEWKNKYELLQDKYQIDTFNLKKDNENILNTMTITLKLKEDIFNKELKIKKYV